MTKPVTIKEGKELIYQLADLESPVEIITRPGEKYTISFGKIGDVTVWLSESVFLGVAPTGIIIEFIES